jgi:2'-5' RNA ligase
MIKPWRVFCAIELPTEVRAQVRNHIARLRESAPTARASWARDEALHITLKFVGEIEPNRVAAISEAAGRAAQRVDPFSIALENTGAFPTRGSPRVLWIGISDSTGNLAKLHESLEDECAIKGFSREERAYHPHLTIARQRAPQGARTPAVLTCEPQFPRVEFTVGEFVLIRSELGPAGSKYTVVSRHELAGE